MGNAGYSGLLSADVFHRRLTAMRDIFFCFRKQSLGAYGRRLTEVKIHFSDCQNQLRKKEGKCCAKVPKNLFNLFLCCTIKLYHM